MGSPAAIPLSLKECIRRFTPAWHSVIMGTSAISILLNVFPYGSHQHSAFQITSLTLLILNTLLFLLFTSLTLARYILFREIWKATLRHPTQSLFLGCFPMGFATILIVAVNVVCGYFGVGGRLFVYALWTMWWVDIVATVGVCFGQLYFMFTRQTHSLSRMTLVWLLPIVTPIVVSAAGAILAQTLLSLPPSASPSSSSIISHVLLTMSACTLLVTIGILLALSIITIYILRLVVYKIPQGGAIFSVFLPLGPLGQAGYTYVVLGEVAKVVFPLSSTGYLDLADNILLEPYTGHILHVLGWFVGFVLWSFATCWVVLGALALLDVLVIRKGKDTLTGSPGPLDPPLPVPVPPFKVTFWGMIFPNGVYANLTIHLAHTTASQVLRVWGTVYVVFTLLLWVYAVVRTVLGVRGGEVFEEVEELEEKREREEEGEGVMEEVGGSCVRERSREREDGELVD